MGDLDIGSFYVLFVLMSIVFKLKWVLVGEELLYVEMVVDIDMWEKVRKLFYFMV